MKKAIVSIAVFAVLAVANQAAILTQWNFNSDPPDNPQNLGTGAIAPAVGNGTAELVGGVTATFAGGSGSDKGADNTAWNTTSYAAQGTGNKTAGVRFNVNTTGYSNIVVGFEQRVSGTASKYSHLQYTTNGTDFLDFQRITMPSNNTFYAGSARFGGVPGVDGNPNFGVRIVTEFESTATEAGASNYVTTSSSAYSINGTIRFDLVTFSGDSSNPPNDPPFISDILDQMTVENTPTGAIPFVVGDSESAPDNLILSGRSSNLALVPNDHIVFGGNGNDRTVDITPALNQSGETLITIEVTDEGGQSTNDTFILTVVPANLPPTLSPIAHQRTLINTVTPELHFSIGDTETALGNLTVSATSSNPTLAPATGIMLGGSGSDRTIAIIPGLDRTGTAVITVSVSDGAKTASSSFVLMVVPVSEMVFYETFDYPNGPLITNSANFWVNHSGTPGQLPVTSGNVTISFRQGEDVHADFPSGAYSAASGVVLYSSFTLRCGEIPLANSEYFAHLFGSSAALRCRIFSSITNAAPGTFRLGIANGSASYTQSTVDLSPNTNYTVVTRYNMASASSTLWINPTAESDPGTSAGDTASAVAIRAYALRQASGIGTMTIDDLKVGTSFTAVVNNGPRLQISASGNDVQVSWPISAQGYVLQSAAGPVGSVWTPVPDEPSLAGDRKVVSWSNVGGTRIFRLIKP